MFYRESQVQFFGKRGTPLHGTMIIRKATAEEKLEMQTNKRQISCTSKCVVEFIDISVDNTKEDGYSVASLTEAVLKMYKQRNNFIDEAFLFTDGAGCFAGNFLALFLTRSFELTGIRVMDHFLSQAGCGKSQLDAHFAYVTYHLTESVRRARGDGDLTGADSIAKALNEREKKTNSKAMIMHRQYNYDTKDNLFAELVLREVAWRGEGRALTAAVVEAMWIDGHHPGATGVLVKPIEEEAKQHKVNERHKTFEAAKAKKVKELKDAADRIAKIRGNFHYCETCSKHYTYEASAAKHVCRGIRTTQVIHPPIRKIRKSTTDSSGFLHGSFKDAVIDMTATRNTTVNTTLTVPLLVDSDHEEEEGELRGVDREVGRGLERTLISGEFVDVEYPEGGACLKKSKDYQPKTIKHMQFIKWAYSLGERNKENAVSPETAHEIMKVVGTEEGSELFPDEEYMTANAHKFPTFGVADLLDVGVIRSYFSKNTAHFDRQIARLQLSAIGEEGILPEEGEEGEDGEGLEDEGEQEAEEEEMRDNDCICKGVKTYKYMNAPYYCPPCLTVLPVALEFRLFGELSQYFPLYLEQHEIYELSA
eukprot:gene31590-39023_t